MSHISSRIAAAVLLISGLSTVSVAQPAADGTMIPGYAEGVYVPYALFGGTTEDRSDPIRGDATVLEIAHVKARVPQHDVDLGRTTVTLRRTEGGTVIRQILLSELWDCLGFNPRTKRFLLASKNEHGVRVSLRGLAWLDEDGHFADTAFGNAGYEARASLVRSDGHYMAFIADSERHPETRLYLYDLDADRIAPLGSAPAPPPLDPQSGMTAADWPWSSFERFYTDLEPAIWSFAPDGSFHVSFGKDTAKRRAAKRNETRWDPAAVFADAAAAKR